MQKILITGSHGFIGGYVLNHLTNYILDCRDLKIEKDLFNVTLEDLKSVDIVIHLASKISVQESAEKPYDYIKQNFMSTVHLADLAEKAGVKKFILASTAAVYAEPMSVYGATKLASEKYLEEKSFDSYSLRFFNVYGKGQNPEYAGAITKFARSIRNYETVHINGDGWQTRDFVYVEDIAKLIKFFCETDKKLIAPIDIGTGKATSVVELLADIGNLIGNPVSSNHLPEVKEVRHSQAKMIGLRSVNAEFQFTTLEEGLRKTL